MMEDIEIEKAIVDAGQSIARALDRLGNADAGTPMGGLEAHGAVLLEAAEKISSALYDVAGAIREVAESIGGS
jgi:hypothetical protein